MGCITELGLIKLSSNPFSIADVILFSPCFVSPQKAVSCTQMKPQIFTEIAKGTFSQMQKQYWHITEQSRGWMSSTDNECVALLLATSVTANLSGKGPIKEWDTANILRIKFFMSTQTT